METTTSQHALELLETVWTANREITLRIEDMQDAVTEGNLTSAQAAFAQLDAMLGVMPDKLDELKRLLQQKFAPVLPQEEEENTIKPPLSGREKRLMKRNERVAGTERHWAAAEEKAKIAREEQYTNTEMKEASGGLFVKPLEARQEQYGYDDELLDDEDKIINNGEYLQIGRRKIHLNDVNPLCATKATSK